MNLLLALPKKELSNDKHELTTTHTPQQNGTAERLNRTLIEGIRTMLADSKLPHSFWAETLSTYICVSTKS